jgi:RNA polymerase sigma-70 factor (ECF subfamily)
LYGEMTDDQLVDLVRERDGDAFDEIVGRYYRPLYNLILKNTGKEEQVEDLLQEVFLKSWQRIDRFYGTSSFFTWIYRIAVNVCLDELRRRKRRGYVRSLDAPVPGGEEAFTDTLTALRTPARDNPDLEHQAREIQRLVHEALGLMKDEQRTILILREMQELSYDQIAEILEINVGTVKSRLSRARSELAKLLRPHIEGQGWEVLQ